MLRSLRKTASKEITVALGKMRSRSGWVYKSVGLLSALLPILVTIQPWIRVFHPNSVNYDNNWILGIWGGSITLFALPVAVATLLTGLQLKDDDRKSIFLEFKKHGFDAVIMTGLVYIGTSGILITYVLGVARESNLDLLGRMLFGLILAFVCLVFLVGLVVFQASNLFLKTNIIDLSRKRLLYHTRLTVRRLGVLRVSERILNDWSNSHSVAISSLLDHFDQEFQFRANCSSILQDINLHALNHWIKKVKFSVNDRTDMKAFLNLGLDKQVRPRTTLAVVSEQSSQTQEDFFRSFKWKDEIKSLDLPLMEGELKAIRGSAVSASETENQVDFERILDVWMDFYRQVLEDAHLLREHCHVDIGQDIFFTLTWVTYLRDIGSVVARRKSEFIRSSWLRFIFNLLRISREFSFDNSIREIMNLIVQFSRGAKDFTVFWTFMRAYTLDLDYYITDRDSLDTKNSLAHMGVQISHLAPQLLTTLPNEQFDSITKWVDEIGQSISAQDRTDDAWTSVREQLALQKKHLWMLYGTWLIKNRYQSTSDRPTVEKQFKYLTSQFNTLQELWDTFGSVSIFDDFTWETLENTTYENMPLFRDPHAGAQLFFIIEALNLLWSSPQSELHPDVNASLEFKEIFRQAIVTVKSDPEEWEPLTKVPANQLDGLLKLLEDMFLNSSDRAQKLLAQRVSGADLDDNLIESFVKRCKTTVVGGGLRIVGRFVDMDALLDDHIFTSEFSRSISDTFLPRRAFINTSDHEDMPLVIRPLWVNEDAFFFSEADKIEAKMVSSREDAIDTLMSVASPLRSASTSCIIVVPSDWRLIKLLVSLPDYEVEINEAWSQIGRLYGISVCRGIGWTNNKALVARLTDWLSVSVSSTDVDDRFEVQVESATVEDFDKACKNGLLMPPDPERLDEIREEFISLNVKFAMRERAKYVTIDPQACTVIKYPVS
ncbi:hypothetical protein D2Q93_09415 [Alicyclobacillaceae bacterium I2511]|nr:hypothetical protein D2Q93_09415 [Alicyclobacillaceae bacterium I2511]